jgi:tRNA(fMet)-specific endonuclease VapC
VTPGPKVLSLDDKVMDYFGKFKAELRRKGQLIGDIDLLIASVAVSNNLTLVTNNTRHFERISELSLENWLTESTTEK